MQRSFSAEIEQEMYVVLWPSLLAPRSSSNTSGCISDVHRESPSPLKGSLVDAWKKHRVSHIPTPRLKRVFLTAQDGGAPRLNEGVLAALIGDLQPPRSPVPSEWHAYQRALHERLSETGAFNSLSLRVQGLPSKPLAGFKAQEAHPSGVLPPHPAPQRVQIVGSVDEASYSLEQDTGIDGLGRPHASVNMSLVSPFGLGDRLTLKLGSPLAERSVGALTEGLLTRQGGAGEDDAGPEKGGALVGGGQASLAHSPWLTATLQYAKPTLGGTRNRLTASAGSYYEDLTSTSGLEARRVGAALTLATPDGRHTLGWRGEQRHVGLLWPTHSRVDTRLPRDLVFSTGPSALSAVAFASRMDARVKDAQGQPVAGQQRSLCVEAAHPVIASQEAFLKTELACSAATSVWRAMPDTGMAAPSMGRSRSTEVAAAEAEEGLRPPRTAKDLPWLQPLSGLGAWGVYAADVLAAWAAPGLTLQTHAAAGALLPLPPQPRSIPHALPMAASPPEDAMYAPWSHYLDRYTMGSAQVPGFHPAGIGPRAKGRALGGTLRLEAGAKLLLPPPLPLPLLTHAGVRGHVWAAAGTCLANESTLRGVAGRIATAPDAASVTTLLASYIAASWGVGVTVPFPVGPGVALELNWRLGAAVPTAPGHQGVLSGSAFSARLST